MSVRQSAIPTKTSPLRGQPLGGESCFLFQAPQNQVVIRTDSGLAGSAEEMAVEDIACLSKHQAGNDVYGSRDNLGTLYSYASVALY